MIATEAKYTTHYTNYLFKISAHVYSDNCTIGLIQTLLDSVEASVDFASGSIWIMLINDSPKKALWLCHLVLQWSPLPALT